MRTASADGAETAMSSPAPMAAAFCTSSMEIRLVSTSAPLPGHVSRGEGACELVERVVPSHSLVRKDQPAVVREPAA